ncbi:hypothetical protein QYE76_012336 [Lolium multiflorum]|uniref:Uncharacterized protein n=1 Tax=Lolium multiflorum TaxID=4521 RepID=A0AAD8U1N4_LOLMU|nr:hypothetical protein QYE76_012336 [Lolium multiflorum]
MAAEDLGNLEWERSKISQQDINMLKKLGISGKQDSLRFPKEESYPTPPMQYRPVQPLQARKTPLDVCGDEDVDRLSTDLSVKDLEKLVRKISSLNKKDTVPTSCGVTPYSATNALPQDHATASPLPPFPKVGKSKKGLLSPTTTRVRLALRVNPQVLENLRHPLKRTLRPRQLPRHALLLQLLLLGARGKGTRLLIPAPPKPVLPVPKKLHDAGKRAFDLYEAALISSGDEEEDAPIDAAARTSMSQNLAEANKRADALAAKLEQSEKARKKAEADAATIEDLRKRLHQAETSLSDNITQQSAREKEIITSLESQSRRFVRRTQQDYELASPEDDPLLDVLSLVEIHGDEGREGLAEAGMGLSRLFPYFFKKKEVPAPYVSLAKCFNSQEDLGLQLCQEGLKVGVEEDMMDELLRMDAEFFVKGSYAEHSTRLVNNERLTIDNILGNN